MNRQVENAMTTALYLEQNLHDFIVSELKP